MAAIVQDIGKIYIFYQIICGAISAVVCLILSIVFYRIRLGWKSKLHRVKSADCTRSRRTTCTQNNRNNNMTSCNTSIVYDCVLGVEGIARSLSNVTSSPYEKGQTVTVYYDPSNVNKTATLHGFPHMLFAGIFLIIGLISAGWAYFLWNVRNNSTAQKIGAVGATLDVVSRLRAEDSVVHKT